MEKTKILKDILTLLKAAKTSPEQFAALIKDDKPHPANSPEDKAHDVAEEDESLKQALSLLDSPEKRSKMLAHLRTLEDESKHRSEENQEAGMAKEEHDEKEKEDSKDEESKEKEDMEKRCWDGYKPVPGKKAYSKGSCVKKDEDKESKEDKKEESKEKEDMSKSEKTPLELAKELLKAAKEAPEQFAELTKSAAPAAAPAPKPTSAKPAAMQKPSMPKMQAMKSPAMAKEEAEEHDEKEKDEKKDDKKEDMEKKAKDMAKCGPMKMSKEEIKADLKKEWKPKFKKDC